MVWLRTCPRCSGDLYLRPELDGDDVVCIQCGLAMTSKQFRAFLIDRRKAPERARQPAAR